MRKPLAVSLCFVLGFTSLVPAALAAESMALYATSSNVGIDLQYDSMLAFDSGDTEYQLIENDALLHDTFTCAQNGGSMWHTAYNANEDALAFSTNGLAGYQYRLKLAFEVSLTKDHVIDYQIKSGYRQIYVVSDDSGNNGADAPSSISKSLLAITGKTSRYTLVVDSDTKTISYYMDGVFQYVEAYSGSSTTLYHIFYSNQSGTTTVRHNYMYYFADYIPTDAKVQIINTPSQTETVVQFSCPVTPDTVESLMVGGNAVTKEDASADYNMPNVWRLTHAELPDGLPALTDCGVRGLSPDGVSDGALLELTFPFIQYETERTFNRPYHRGMRFVQGEEVEGFLCRKNHNNFAAYGYTGDAWRFFSVLDEREQQFWWQFDVDLTKDHVIDYQVKATIQFHYAPGYCYTDADGTVHESYIDNATQMSTCVLRTTNGSGRYTLVIDSDTKTITWYKNGVYTYTKSFAEELGADAELVTLHHRVYCEKGGREDNTTANPLDASGNVRYVEFDYFLDYQPGTAAMRVIEDVSSTQTVVQFNTPVDSDTVGSLKVGGNAVTAEDASSDYDLPNTYRLTHTALSDGTYVITDGGVRGLSPDGTSAGNLLNVKDVAFTYEKKHGITVGERSFTQTKDEISVTVPVTNHENTPQSFTMLLCEYQENNVEEREINRVVMITHTATVGAKEEVFSIPMASPAAESGAYYYEAFIWDGVTDMIPITDKSAAAFDAPEDYPTEEYTFDGYSWYKSTPTYTVADSTLTAMEGQHPRLFLTDDFVSTLKSDIKTGGSLNDKWTQFIKYVDSVVADASQPPTDFDKASEDYGNKIEENWIRDVADDLASIAFAYAITKEDKYLAEAKEFVTALCVNYPQWGAPQNADGSYTEYHNNGLAAAHASRALALTYDWLFDDIGESYRDLILTAAKERTSMLHSGGWWSSSYLQNHLWNDRLGTALMGIAIMDEYPTAKDWIHTSVSAYNQVYRHLGRDGASHEGMLYWNYGLESYLLFLKLANDVLGIDYTQDPYAKNTYLTPLYNYFNPADWNKKSGSTWELCLNYADAPIYGGHLTGPSIALDALAKTYNNGTAKWLANRMYETGVNAAKESYNDWFAFLYQSDVAEVSPHSLPTGHLFEDLGIVESRSSWDEGASYFHVRCGINQGSEVAIVPSGYNPGTGHVHVDINAPIIYAFDDYILKDDGYVKAASGKNHSVLYINGEGQPRLTDGSYLNRARCAVLKYKDTKAYTYAACDGTDAYGITSANIAKFGLENWVRHFVFLKQHNCLLVIDEISCDKTQELQLQWITEALDFSQPDDRTIIGKHTTSNVRIENFDTDGKTEVLVKDVLYGASGSTATRNVPTVNRTAKAWTTATAISYSALEQTPAEVSLTQNGNLWQFEVNGSMVTVDIAEKTVAVR